MTVFVPGLRLGERYVLEAPIGVGGMSQVWRAVDEVLARPVAVKTLDAQLVDDPALRAAVRREARAAASITHPHVTQVYDFGEAPVPGGGVAPYLVMELLVGEDLSARLGGGALPWPEAVQVCADVAGALAAAHRLGVVHRDIKPGNVMLTTSGAKVVDFGIAATLEMTQTLNHQMPRAGTPAYLAPEILGGATGTPSSDVYSLGALLHTTLTGQPPLAVSSWADAAQAHQHGAGFIPLAVPGLPGEVRDLSARCLASKPHLRPTSDEAAHVLSRWSGAPALTVSRPPVPVPTTSIPTAIPTTAPTPAMVNPTLLESQPPPARPAARHVIVVPPPRRRTALAVFATGLALVGILIMAIAAGVLQNASKGNGGAAGPTPGGTTAAPQPTVPRDPQTPSNVLTAIETTIAGALLSGSIDDDMAADLSKEVTSLRNRLGGRDLGHRAENLREDVAHQIEEGRLNPAVGNQLIHLLDVLIQLSPGD